MGRGAVSSAGLPNERLIAVGFDARWGVSLATIARGGGFFRLNAFVDLAPVDTDVRWESQAQLDRLAANIDHGDFDVVVDNDRFADFTGQIEHSVVFGPAALGARKPLRSLRWRRSTGRSSLVRRVQSIPLYDLLTARRDTGEVKTNFR